MTAELRYFSDISHKILAYAPVRYRWWCGFFYLGWLAVCVVFAHYLIEVWWAGIPIGLVTGAPLLLRLRQPAWLGTATIDDEVWLVGGYTEMPNWQVPVSEVAGIWHQNGPLTGQVCIQVAARDAVRVHNRKGLTRGSLRENEAKTGAAIHMDFFQPSQVAELDAMLIEARAPATD